ncbi:hypothetical protein BIFDEN_02309 [Bifidobacterium dentium ATCC 27678]|nr:hypothetical protein BIFDEN_02309 [Bifidobacterium dentium ATCC 27678]
MSSMPWGLSRPSLRGNGSCSYGFTFAGVDNGGSSPLFSFVSVLPS